MKFKPAFTAFVIASSLGASGVALAEDDQPQVFTGDVKLACEAILCLSTGAPPSECTPSLRRYFSIVLRKWSDTVDARHDFLNLCPTSQENNLMRSLVSALSQGSGKCDAAGLNQMNAVVYDNDSGATRINNSVPAICTQLYTHELTDLAQYQPKYVGVPERGGYFVEPDKYEAALAAYNARIKAEDREHQRRSWGN